MRIRRIGRIASFLLALVLVASLGEAERVIAIGDIHGAFDPLVSILRQVRLIDDRNHWVGEDATLVVTGDFLDRGPRVFKVADLLMDLERKAPKAGGRVIVLLGNHEIMNLLGDRRYIPAKALTDLQDRGSEFRQSRLLKDNRGVLRRLSGDRKLKMSSEAKQAFLRSHPAGLVEYAAALSPTGHYGSWIRTLPAVARVGDGVFVHGGISPLLEGKTILEINETVEREIDAWDRCFEWLLEDESIHKAAGYVEVLTQVRDRQEDPELLAECKQLSGLPESYLVRADGPFWFRDYSSWTEEEGEEFLQPILEGLKAKYLVVGHTPNPELGIVMRLSGRVFLIDSGMLKEAYGGEAYALEIEGSRISASTLGRTIILQN